VWILGRLWFRDDFAPPFRDIKGCVSLSVRKASRFLVFIFCSHLYFVNWTGWADIEFLCMLGSWFWSRRRLLPAGRTRVCNTPRWTRPRAEADSLTNRKKERKNWPLL